MKISGGVVLVIHVLVSGDSTAWWGANKDIPNQFSQTATGHYNDNEWGSSLY